MVLRTPSVTSHQLNVTVPTLEVVMRLMITFEDERFHENDEWFHDVTWWLKYDVTRDVTTRDELCCLKLVCLELKHVCLVQIYVSSLRKNYVLSFHRLV